MVSSMNCNCWASKHCLGQRSLSFHYAWLQPRSRAVPVESPQCSVDTCVEDLERFCCEELGLVLELVHIVARVRRLSSCTTASTSSARFRRRCLLLALFFSPAVGPLFPASIMHRVVMDLDHASRCSGPQPLSSGILSRDHPGHVC